VTQDLLNTLEQQRLLRKEPRLDSFYYEISHDTLLAPIVKSRNERKEKEEKERLAREAAEQEARNKALQAQVEREQSLRQKAKNTTIFAVAVAVLALLAAVFGYVQMQTAKQKEQEAVKTQENAENEKNKATENFEKYLNGQRIMEAQKWLQSGDSYFGFGKTEEAKNSYKKGIDIMESKDSYKKDIDVMESNQSDILYQELIEKWNRCK
jgi:tetratricopeptide (TPR) repeat protein